MLEPSATDEPSDGFEASLLPPPPPPELVPAEPPEPPELVPAEPPELVPAEPAGLVPVEFPEPAELPSGPVLFEPPEPSSLAAMGTSLVPPHAVIVSANNKRQAHEVRHPWVFILSTMIPRNGCLRNGRSGSS